jgi:DNA-binding MarR family transcriptional regulator
LHQLEAQGLVRRCAATDDRRQVWIEITEQGLARLRDDMQPRVTWLARAIAPLSPTEQEVLRLAAALMEDLARWEPPAEDREGGATGPATAEGAADA